MGVGEGNIESRLDAIRQMPRLLPENERARYSVNDLSAGGYLRIESKVYRVDARCRYVVSASRSWNELRLYCLSDGTQGGLVWREGDGRILSLQVEKLRLQDIGVSQDSLSSIYDDEKGSFIYRGRTYRYYESNRVSVCRTPGKDCEDILYWDFDGGDGARIQIRRWTALDYEVCLYRKISNRSVEVISFEERL